MVLHSPLVMSSLAKLMVFSFPLPLAGGDGWSVASLKCLHDIKVGFKRFGERNSRSEVYWHTTGRLINTYTGQTLARVEGMETVQPLDWWSEADVARSSNRFGSNNPNREQHMSQGSLRSNCGARKIAPPLKSEDSSRVGDPGRIIAYGRFFSRKVFVYFDMKPSGASSCLAMRRERFRSPSDFNSETRGKDGNSDIPHVEGSKNINSVEIAHGINHEESDSWSTIVLGNACTALRRILRWTSFPFTTAHMPVRYNPYSPSFKPAETRSIVVHGVRDDGRLILVSGTHVSEYGTNRAHSIHQGFTCSCAGFRKAGAAILTSIMGLRLPFNRADSRRKVSDILIGVEADTLTSADWNGKFDGAWSSSVDQSTTSVGQRQRHQMSSVSLGGSQHSPRAHVRHKRRFRSPFHVQRSAMSCQEPLMRLRLRLVENRFSSKNLENHLKCLDSFPSMFLASSNKNGTVENSKHDASTTGKTDIDEDGKLFTFLRFGNPRRKLSSCRETYTYFSKPQPIISSSKIQASNYFTSGLFELVRRCGHRFGNGRINGPCFEYTRTGPCPAWASCGGTANMCTLELSGRRFQSKEAAATALVWLRPSECLNFSWLSCN